MSASASIDAFLSLNHDQFSSGLKTSLNQAKSFASDINKLLNSIKGFKIGDFGNQFKLTKKELEDIAKQIDKLKNPLEKFKPNSSTSLPGINKDIMDAQAGFKNLGMSVTDVQAKLATPTGNGLAKAVQEAQSSFANLNRDITTTYSKFSTPIDFKLIDAVNEAQSSFGNLSNAASSSTSSINQSINNLQSSFGNLSNTATATGATIANSLTSVNSSTSTVVSGLGSIEGALSNVSYSAQNTGSTINKSMNDATSSSGNLTQSLGGVQGALAGILGVIGTQSLGEMIFGNSMKAEVNQVLLKNMTQTAQGAKALYNTVDEATNKTLVSMQSVIPALNKFKASTGANEESLRSITPQIANFGSYVYAMTGSAALADTAMMDLSKGIDGAYASIDQYGITEKSLMNTGLWTGKADDVEGYMNAIEAVIGSTDELMDTTQGKLTQVYKKLSVGAKALGAELLPFINAVVDGFLSLNKATDGNFAKVVMGAGLALSGFLVVAGGIKLIGPMFTSNFGMMTSVVGKLGRMMGVTSGETSILSRLMKKLGADIGSAGDATGKLEGKTKGPSGGKDNPGGGVMNTANIFKNLGATLKAAGRVFVVAAVAIALGMALITEAIILMNGPLLAFATLGATYKWQKGNIDAGVAVLKQTAIILVPIGVAVAALSVAMSVFSVGLPAMAVGMVAAAIGIAIVMALVTEAIYLLKAPLWALSEVGKDFIKNQASITAGTNAIRLIATTLVSIAPALILFGAAVLLFGAIPPAGLIAATGIAITMGLAVEAIHKLEGPLNKIAELGGKFGDLSGIKAGVEAIKSALTAITMIRQIYTEASKVNTEEFKSTGSIWSDIVLWVKNIIDDKNSLDGLINVMGDLKEFITKFNSITADLPKVTNIDALKNVLNVIKDINNITTEVTNGLKGINNMKWESDWSNFSTGPFDKLGEVVLGVSNFIKNTAGKIRNIPKIETSELEGLKSAVTTITEISKVSTEMTKAIKSINGMQESNSNAKPIFNEFDLLANFFKDGKGPFDKIGTIVDGVINFMNNNKGKLEGIDTEAMTELDENFRQLTSGFNYFLNDTIKISNNLVNLGEIPEVNYEQFTRIEGFVDYIKTSIGKLKTKMDGVETGDYADIGTKFRSLTSQFGYFLNDTVKISNTLNSLSGVEEPDWSLFSRIETITGRVITSLKTLKAKLEGAEDVGAIGETWRSISSQFMYFANDYNKINTAMSTIGDEPIPYEKFTNLEITIGRVITSLKSISDKVNNSGINGDSGAAGISSAVQAVADTIKQINIALSNASGVEGAARNLGAKIPAGIKAGINGASLGSAIVSSITTSINSKNSYFTSSGKRLGTSLANGFRSTAIQLKTIAAAEVDWALNAINSRASSFWTAGARLGSSLLGGYKSAQNIASPGLVAKTTAQEMDYTLNMISNTVPQAYTMATNLGNSIVSGFGSPSLQVGDTEGLAQVQNNAQTALGLVQNTANTTTRTFTGMDSKLISTFNGLANNTRNTFTGINTSTNVQMKDMATKTTSQIGNIKSSWTFMQDALINSAANIRTKTGAHINKLQDNMAGFWRKVRNPVLLLGSAGPSQGSKSNNTFVGRRSAPSGSFPKFSGPEQKSLSRSQSLGANGFKLLDSFPYLACNDPDGCYAGTISLNNWTTSVKSKLKNWNTNFGPIYDPYLNVGKFENSNFPVSGNSQIYEALAMDMIGKTVYDYYFNSKGGSLASIYESGLFNCWDGAHILMALASSFGLSSTLVHGYWGSTPHVWANVQGVGNIDTTAIQNGYGKFAHGKAHAGPAPKTPNPEKSGNIVNTNNVEVGDIHIHLEGTDNSEELLDEIKDELKPVVEDVFDKMIIEKLNGE